MPEGVLVQPADIWTRIDAGERTSALEAWGLLRELLTEACERDDNPELVIPDAAIAVASALDLLDQRATERETLLYELRSERGPRRCRELDELLVRMLDPEADDRLDTYPAALEALAGIEGAVRAQAAPSPSTADPSGAGAQSPPGADATPSSADQAGTGAGSKPASGLGCGLLAVIPMLLLASAWLRATRTR